MKTYVLGLIAFGLTNLMIAQNGIAAITVSQHSNYYKSESIANLEYLNTANHEDISNKVNKIQMMVANYDIKKADIYQSKSNSTYSVSFKEGDNTILAVYNKQGELISCKENYQSIKLPYTISSKISKEHPGWSFDSINCDILYSKDDGRSISYRIVIKQGRKTKKISISV